MKTVHIEVIVPDDQDTSRLRNAVAVEASEIEGVVLSDFEMPSTRKELQREQELT